MIALFEKAYFAELERKTQLNNALAFPVSIVFGGVALLGYSAARIVPESPAGAISVLCLFFATTTFVMFVLYAWRFSIHDDYEYIWFMDDTLGFRDELRRHYENSHGETEADDAFEERLIFDLARCASKNARLNDKRAGDIYRCRASALFFILASFVLSIIGTLAQLAST